MIRQRGIVAQNGRLLLQFLMGNPQVGQFQLLFRDPCVRLREASLPLLIVSPEFVDLLLFAACSFGLSLATPQKKSGENSHR